MLYVVVEDLTSIYATNAIAVLLLLILFICNFWRFQYKTYENKILIYMIILGFIASFDLVLSYLVDGKAGMTFRFLNHLTSSFIFVANMVGCFLWVLLIETHLRCEPSTRKKTILAIPMVIGLITILINLFVPCIYELDANNVYSRKPLYSMIFAIDILYMIYALIVFVINKVKGGLLKFFPIYLYIGPILLALILETLIPGITLSWPCYAISIAGVLASLQNEVIYKDQLTGLYNRSYLNFLQKNIFKKNNLHITGVMLDLDDFKHINDKYGHAKGDIALQQMAKILQEAVGDMGNVIRYAGDEFIVLINSHKQIIIDACLAEITNCINKFNESGIAEYKLSASMGYSIYNPKTQTVDDFMNNMDQNMYKNKNEYHHVEE